MKITYNSVREPRWTNHNKNAIDCRVYFDHLESEVPFTASATDIEQHGRDIFSRCIEGEFGEIASPVATNAPDIFGNSSPPPGWHEVNQFLEEANKENASGTERGLVLVWSAMLDEMLCRLLERFLVEDKITQSVLRGGPSNPLTSFSSRTKVAFSLGLIAKDEMQAIDKVRAIRNDFAHKVGVSLEDQSFRSKCEDIYSKTVGDATAFEARHLYSSGCARLLMVLSCRIGEFKQEQERLQERYESKPLQQR